MMRALACIGALWMAACSGPTELVVITRSDLAVPTELDEVVLDIAGPSGDAHTRQALLTGPDAQTLPLTAVLLHQAGELGPVELRVTGRRGGVEVLHRDADAWFVPGRSVLVLVDLASACGGLSCDGGAACLDGGCARPLVEPQQEMHEEEEEHDWEEEEEDWEEEEEDWDEETDEHGRRRGRGRGRDDE